MIIYPDIEKELSFDDYKKPELSIIRALSLESLYELQNNMESAIDNAYINHADLLAMAIETDLNTINLYIRMRQKQAEKQAKKGE